MKRKTLQRFFTAFSILTFGWYQHANAQGANTYQFTAVAGTYTDMIGGTAFTAVQSDDVCPAATVPLGFTFNFCGTDYTTVRAGSNGYLTFIPTGGSTAFNDVSSFGTIKPALYWLWDDLNGATTGAATYLTTGTAPNRIFTFQFKNWRWNWSATGPNISVQVKLYESSNVIEYIYNQESQPGAPLGSGGASIGIVDGQSTPTYLSLSDATAAPVASSTTFTAAIGTKPASGQIYRFKPVAPIDMRMDSVVMNPHFCSNASAPVSVKVSNQGTALINNMQIDWTLDGVPQASVNYTAPTPITNFTTAPNNTAIVSLGDVFFADNTPKVVRAWVVQANSLPDAVNTNDTVIASVAPDLTGVTVNITPHDTIICKGTNLVLDAGANHPTNPIYIWSTTQISSSITVSDAGVYSVFVQNADGCFDRDTVTVEVHPEPLINSIAIIDNGDGSFTFNAIGAQNVVNYGWDFGDGNTQGGTGIPGQVIHAYQDSGSYIATLTIMNDCGSVTVTRIISNAGNTSTGISNVSALQKAVSISPNPSKGLVVISASSKIKMKSVSIYNILGQKISAQDKLNTEKYELDVAELSVGIYSVIIETDSGNVTKKLEVIR